MTSTTSTSPAEPWRQPKPAGLLFSALSDPDCVSGFSAQEWDDFLRLAQIEGLLPRIAMRLAGRAHGGSIPSRARDRLEAARVIADNHTRMIRWEVDRIGFALRTLDTPILLLKGAAYLLADLPLARGRLVSDVDILVPAGNLHAVESALLEADWTALKLDPYDQRYYRRWMHELPPLRHRARGTTVDVHHRILPRTSRLNPDPEQLWEHSVSLGDSGMRVLSPPDMLLHCAVHLFHDGDLDHGLRDLVDLHDMFTGFGRQPGFWDALTARAEQLGVSRPLFYAARYTRRILGTPVPEHFLSDNEAAAPPWPVARVMDSLVHRVLTPEHPDRRSRSMALARWLLYIRSHYLRMPLYLLIPHLVRKSFRKNRPPD